MAENVAGALLFLVPVVVAAIVAYVVTRPERDRVVPTPADPPGARIVPFERRSADRRGQQAECRRQPAPPAHPTLLHAALSSHLSAVSGTNPGPAGTASRAAGLSAFQAARAAKLVSIRRPARIPRRPSHRCPHRPS